MSSAVTNACFGSLVAFYCRSASAPVCLTCPFLIVPSCVYACTLLTCVCVLCCAAPADLCLLPMEEGSCGRYTLRWYFNSQVQACRPFIYSGCEGNGNRFLHQEECEEVCLGKTEGTRTHTQTHTNAWLCQVLNVRRLTTDLSCRSSEDSAMIVAKSSSATRMLAFILLLQIITLSNVNGQNLFLFIYCFGKLSHNFTAWLRGDTRVPRCFMFSKPGK